MTGQTAVQIGAVVFVAFAITATAMGLVRKEEVPDPASPNQHRQSPIRFGRNSRAARNLERRVRAMPRVLRPGRRHAAAS